jgi:hypothetical protein
MNAQLIRSASSSHFYADQHSAAHMKQAFNIYEFSTNSHKRESLRFTPLLKIPREIRAKEIGFIVCFNTRMLHNNRRATTHPRSNEIELELSSMVEDGEKLEISSKSASNHAKPALPTLVQQ